MTAKSEKDHGQKSILDVMQQNLRLYDRNNFVHRLIYIGNFLLKEEPSEDHLLREAFEKNIKQHHDRYSNEKLTGFLLLYCQHFCHVLEGSEDSLAKYLYLMCENDILKKKIGTLKLLAVYHHVNQRLVENWMILLANFSNGEDSQLENASIRHYKIKCIEKLYHLGLSLRQNKIPEQHDVSQRPFSKRKLKSKPSSGTKDTVVKVSVFLPELQHLNILLESSETLDLKEYMRMYDTVPCLDVYEEMVWPIPCDYTPMHIFQKDPEPIKSLGNISEVLLNK